MLKFATILLLTALAASSATEIKDDEGVLVLTKDNFEEVLAKHDKILVEFYAPWCGHCKALAPEYVKAAAKLAESDSDIKLGKVDATIESSLAEKFGVRGYPTLKFFKNGQPIEYTGGRQADEIVNWLNKKTGPPAKSLSASDELESFIKDHEVAIVGYFTDTESSGAKNFIQVASAIDDAAFGIVSIKNLIDDKKVEDGQVWLYKKFDEGEVQYSGPENPNELKKFITSESLPLIVEFNHDTAQKIFGGDVKSHLLLFLSKDKGHFDEYLDAVKPVAKEFRDKLLFVVINVDETDHQRIVEFFGLQPKEVPTMRAIRLEDEMSKFKPPTDSLAAENVKSFVEDFLGGKLKEHLLSQDLPEDWDKEPVKVLVASKFDEVVFDKTKDVLVEFYAPWCGHCKQLVPIYEKLAESFKDREDVLIAKIDSTVNELEHTKITSFPTIKMFKKETNEVVEYTGQRTLEELSKFVESGGAQPAKPAEMEENGRRFDYESDFNFLGSYNEEEEEEEEDLPKKDEL